MKSQDVTSIYRALQGLKDKRLPIRLSFLLTRNISKLQEINDDIQSQKKKIIERYGSKDKDGNLIIGDNGGVFITDTVAADKELAELFQTDVKVDLEEIPQEDIENYDDDKYDVLTFGELEALLLMRG